MKHVMSPSNPIDWPLYSVTFRISRHDILSAMNATITVFISKVSALTNKGTDMARINKFIYVSFCYKMYS